MDTDRSRAPLPPGAGFDEGTLYRSLFTASPDALLLVDAGGAIVLANPAAARLLGYGVEELQGLNVDAPVPDAARPRHAAYRAEVGAAAAAAFHGHADGAGGATAARCGWRSR